METEFKSMFQKGDVLPETAIELVDWADKKFALKDCIPQLVDTERYIFFKAGIRFFIDQLVDMKIRTLTPPPEVDKPDPKAYYVSDNFPTE